MTTEEQASYRSGENVMTPTLVINTHDQLLLNGGGVAIVPSYGGTRTRYFYGWAVYRINKRGSQIVTDPNAHWSDHGKKVFSASLAEGETSVERSRNALAAAKKWVAEQGWYDGEWARNRIRDYVPKDVNKRFPIRKD